MEKINIVITIFAAVTLVLLVLGLVTKKYRIIYLLPLTGIILAIALVRLGVIDDVQTANALIRKSVVYLVLGVLLTEASIYLRKILPVLEGKNNSSSVGQAGAQSVLKDGKGHVDEKYEEAKK
ncbi:MAG: hypothetical protein AAB549_00800 [Patescibacteria group bacterium]